MQTTSTDTAARSASQSTESFPWRPIAACVFCTSNDMHSSARESIPRSIATLCVQRRDECCMREIRGRGCRQAKCKYQSKQALLGHQGLRHERPHALLQPFHHQILRQHQEGMSVPRTLHLCLPGVHKSQEGLHRLAAHFRELQAARLCFVPVHTFEEGENSLRAKREWKEKDRRH